MRSLIRMVFVILLTGVFLKGEDNRIQTAVNPRSDGHVDVTISNRYNVPITAYVVVANHTPLVSGVRRHTSVRYMDSVFSSLYAPPIGPKDSQTLTFAGPHPGPDKQQTDVEVKAAIFADGSTFGDPEWVDRLIRGRKSLYRNLTVALDTLQAARGTGASYAELKQTIQGIEQTALNATQDREERRGASKVFETVLANLAIETRVDGTPIPIDERIAFVIDRLTESRQVVLAAKPRVALE